MVAVKFREIKCMKPLKCRYICCIKSLNSDFFVNIVKHTGSKCGDEERVVISVFRAVWRLVTAGLTQLCLAKVAFAVKVAKRGCVQRDAGVQ